MNPPLNKALLLIDRGSREPEVRNELQELCTMAARKAHYDSVSYCFLEVIPPFIEEGINKCLDAGAGQITIMPYFLYPGMKLKDTVKKAALIMKDQKLRMVISKPLSYHSLMAKLICERISEVKADKGLNLEDSECDILLIGHGSSDRNAHDAFMNAADAVRPLYRRVHHCFLELDSPNIKSGIADVIKNDPRIVIMMPYFLHRGAHIKRDVVEEVEASLAEHAFNNAFMARHLGVDEKLVELVLQRASEAERRAGFESR